jgi:hypothetical protein
MRVQNFGVGESEDVKPARERKFECNSVRGRGRTSRNRLGTMCRSGFMRVYWESEADAADLS